MYTRVRTIIQTRLHPAIMGAAVFFLISSAHAQTTSSVVYVCQEKGVLTLQNTQAHTNTATRTCNSKIITVREIPREFSRGFSRQTTPFPALRQMGDPMPTAQTLIVGAQVPSAVQQQRDFGRRHIVQSELNAAEQRLIKLQIEYNNGQPERMGHEKNHPKYLDRVAGLKQNIQLTQSSIDALKRELTRVHGAQ
ncbi:MAG: hypothetical protein H6R05_1496 [Burkholderiaceae bacterium]|nr:hypothetical protein [Burkholderiaceae bacterium]